MLHQLRRRLQYRINRAFARRSSLLYVGLVLFTALVVLAGANAYFLGLFSDRGLAAEGISDGIDGGPWDSLLWSVKHVIDPGAFAEDYGAPGAVLVISLIISLLGMAIFGTLVGLITSLVQRRVAQVERGNAPVVEQGHTLVLGWNYKTPAVLRGLADLGSRTLVVLAPRERQRMADVLRAEGVLRRDREVVLRTGSPSRKAELRNVAFEHAASIIVVGSEIEDGRSRDPDIEVIKTLLVLSSFEGWAGEPPRIVGEIDHKPNYEIARIASRKLVPLVSSAEVVSRLLVQAARYRGLSGVYLRLFSEEGGAIHVRKIEDWAGRRFGDLAFELSEAVPIGVSWTVEEGADRRTAVALNPEPDYELDEDESLVLLSPGARFSRSSKHAPPPERDLPANADDPPPRAQLSRVLILGWSRFVDEILAELDAHATQELSATLAADVDEEEMRSHLESAFETPLQRVRIQYLRTNTVRRGSLEGIDLSAADCIFVLADEDRGEDPDASTLLTLLLLRDRLERVPDEERPRVVAEIREERNRELLDGLADDVVVSPEVVSVLLTQISQVPVLGPVYRELLSAGGIEICLRPAEQYASLDEPCSFAELILAGHRALEIVLGVVHNGGGSAPEVRIAPPPDTPLSLSSGDQVIVLAQQVYA